MVIYDQEKINTKLTKAEEKEAKHEEEDKKFDAIITTKIKEEAGNTDAKITTMHEDTLVKLRDISQNMEAVKTEQGKLKNYQTIGAANKKYKSFQEVAYDKNIKEQAIDFIETGNTEYDAFRKRLKKKRLIRNGLMRDDEDADADDGGGGSGICAPIH